MGNSRNSTWIEISKFLEKYFPRNVKTVVEIGAGRCSWINSVRAPHRFAVDISEIVYESVENDVSPIVGDVTDLSNFKNDSVDVVLASNLFEHLHIIDVEKTLGEIHRILENNGRLIILQPNFKYAQKEYFDDYTHITIFNDTGFSELLGVSGFNIIKRWKRLVPFSFKSSPISVPKFIVWVYLRFPIRPFAKQMVFVCQKSK